MKKLSLLIITLLPLLALGQSKYQYVSPWPGSKYNDPTHDIIIREGSLIKAASLNARLFTIEGSKSGVHSYTSKVCLDGKTILIHPSTPFAYDEQVTVSVGNGLQSTDGRTLNNYSFSFNTHREYTKLEKENFVLGKSILQKQEMAQYPNGDQSEGGDGGTRDYAGLVTITNNTNPSPGYIFFDAFSGFFFNTKWTGYHIMDNNGDSIYSVELANPSDFEMVDNGNFTVREGSEVRFDELDSNFNIINKIYGANGYGADFHDCQISADQYVLLIADDNEIVDMTVYNPNYSSHATVYGTAIQKFDPDGNLIFEWRSLDHIEVTEAEHVNLGFSFIDYIHTNSVEEDNDGNIIFSNRHLDQVDKINASTGEFIWRLGGQLGDMTFINDNEKFTYQHDARRIANGNLTLWDNGNYHTPAHSTAKEYQIDEVNKTATLVWSYGHPGGQNGNSIYNTAGGSVQRLSNGNTFINGGWRSNNNNPSMWEVTPDGTIVWEAKLTSNSSMTSYRAHRYDWNPCPRPTFKKMKTKDITASSAKLKWSDVIGVSEYHLQYKKHSDDVWTEKTIDATKNSKKVNNLDPDTKYDWRVETWCDSLGVKVSGYTDIKKFTTLAYRDMLAIDNQTLSVDVYPNPAHDNVSIESTSSIDQVRIVDLVGREMMNVFPDDSQINLPVSNLPAGNYLVIVKSDGQQQVKKLVIE